MITQERHDNATTPVWVLVTVGCILSVALLGFFLRSMDGSKRIWNQATAIRSGWLLAADDGREREHRIGGRVYELITDEAGDQVQPDPDMTPIRGLDALRADADLAQALPAFEGAHAALDDLLAQTHAWQTHRTDPDAKDQRNRLLQTRLPTLEAAAASRQAVSDLVVQKAALLDQQFHSSVRAAALQSSLAVGAYLILMVVLGRRVTRSIRAGMNDLADAARQLRAKEVQLAQSQRLEAIGQLAAGIAHEINTPVHFTGDNLRFLSEQFTGVFWVLDAYFRELAEDAPAKAWVERREEMNNKISAIDYPFLREEVPKAFEAALDGLERVATIVRAMKDFSHPGAKDKQSTDLNRAVESTVTVCKNRWKYAAEVTMELDKKLPRVPCMVAELNQVLLNLIVNAADAIVDRYGEGHLGHIKVSTRLDGQWAEIRVQDDGVGMTDEVRARIYDPFFTTKGVGKGTGQGLAISRDIIVSKHGGQIECESRTGVGTTFIIRLPLTDPHLKTVELKEAA